MFYTLQLSIIWQLKIKTIYYLLKLIFIIHFFTCRSDSPFLARIEHKPSTMHYSDHNSYQMQRIRTRPISHAALPPIPPPPPPPGGYHIPQGSTTTGYQSGNGYTAGTSGYSTSTEGASDYNERYMDHIYESPTFARKDYSRENSTGDQSKYYELDPGAEGVLPPGINVKCIRHADPTSRPALPCRIIHTNNGTSHLGNNAHLSC